MIELKEVTKQFDDFKVLDKLYNLLILLWKSLKIIIKAFILNFQRSFLKS